MVEFDPNTQYYKFLKSGGRPSIAVTRMRWDLPTVSEEHGNVPGRWHIARVPIMPCASGLHVTTAEDAWRWTSTDLFEVEIDPRVHKVKVNTVLGKTTIEYESVVGDTSKLACRRVRLVRRVPEWNQQAEWDFCRTVLRAMRDYIVARDPYYDTDDYRQYMDAIGSIINAEHLRLDESQVLAEVLLNPRWYGSDALAGRAADERRNRWRSLINTAQMLNGSRIERTARVVASYHGFLSIGNKYGEPAFDPSVTGFIPALLGRR